MSLRIVASLQPVRDEISTEVIFEFSSSWERICESVTSRFRE
jgi:hypothetical protein